MQINHQNVLYNWLRSAIEWFEHNYLEFFIHELTKIFSFKVNELQILQISIKNIKFAPEKRYMVAKTQKIIDNHYQIELNEIKLDNISQINSQIRKYIIVVIIGHELIHIIQFHLKSIGSKKEEAFSKSWVSFLRDVKAYKYSQVIAAKHYTINKGLPEKHALKVFSPVFNYYHQIL